MVIPVITGAAHAFPPAVEQKELWDGYFAEHYANSPLARRLFANAGPDRRHAAVNPLIEDASQWTTAQRMERYLPEALPLTNAAVREALGRSGVAAADVGQLIVVSCTGYVTPGVDAHVVAANGFDPSVQRLLLGHMGCHAALPAMTTAADFVRVNERPAVVVCVELGSLHLQPSTNDAEQMVAHALFSDAASAFVVEPDAPAGLAVVDTVTASDFASADLMTWKVSDAGFRMGLSQKVPDALEPAVRPALDRLLSPHYLTADDVAGWALHPGGPRIIDAVQRSLKLEDEALSSSRAVLREHGNCSSPTVLVVLDDVRGSLAPGDHVVAMAFGPGLTLAGVLLRTR